MKRILYSLVAILMLSGATFASDNEPMPSDLIAVESAKPTQTKECPCSPECLAGCKAGDNCQCQNNAVAISTKRRGGGSCANGSCSTSAGACANGTCTPAQAASGTCADGSCSNSAMTAGSCAGGSCSNAMSSGSGRRGLRLFGGRHGRGGCSSCGN